MKWRTASMRAGIEQGADATQVLGENALDVGKRVNQLQRRYLRRPDQAKCDSTLIGGLKHHIHEIFSPGLRSHSFIGCP
jgi:hypothetical protein